MLSPGFESLSLLALLNQEKVLDKVDRIATSFDCNSLLNGQTDVFNAYRSNEPYLFESQGHPVTIINPEDYGIYFYGDTLFTSETFLKNQPKALEKFRKASIKGWEYALSHADEAIAVIQSQYQVTTSLKHLRFEAAAIKKAIQPDQVEIGTMDLARWAQINHHLIAIGAVPPNFHMENSFLYSPPRGINWEKLWPWIAGVITGFALLLIFLSVLFRSNVRLKATRKDLTQEINERKRAEEEIRQSKNEFRLLADHTYDWEYWRLPDGSYRYVSPACERITGYSPDEFIAQRQLVLDIVEPDFADQVERHYCDEDTATNGLSHLVFAIRTRTGERRWIEHHCTPVFDDQGVYAGRRGNNRDITDRKQAEEALCKSEEMMRSSQSVAHICSYSTNLNINNIEQSSWVCSPEFYNIFGIDENYPHTIAGWANFIHPDHREEVFDYHESVVKEKKSFSREYKIIRIIDGSERWVHGTGELDFDEKGNPVRMHGAIQDITERKQAEKERQELETQLRQKYKMEAVGTMAGGIAHNFNNSLSVILGNLELSQLKNNNPEVSILLQNARIGVMRSRDLVSQIMSYSRKGAQSMAPLHLPLIIDETLKLLSSTIPTTVQLHQAISPDSAQATINADASQIQEILLNLYSNAVHAMEEKGRLDITLDVVDLTNKELPHPGQHQPGRYARITIRDTGCGMTAEVQQKIFDPFFTTKEMHEGTGMGLSTVQGIIEQHNGLITVESTVGQGTAFALYFPVIDQAQATQPTPVKVDIPSGAEKILFVDDDEMLAKLGERMLTELGYQVSMMTESPEALKLFAANADYFDLVITDQTMPDLTGKELIQELLKIRPDIPTIICTGYSSQVSEEEAEKLGAKAFVMKPLDLQELAQTVRRVLDEGREESPR